MKIYEQQSQNKSDRDKGHSSHVIFALKLWKIHLAFLMTSMNLHGNTPDDMLKGTLVQLDKDKKCDKCDSDNCRGICLSSSITKVNEWVLVAKYEEKLCTSNLQYSFKATFSFHKITPKKHSNAYLIY